MAPDWIIPISRKEFQAIRDAHPCYTTKNYGAERVPMHGDLWKALKRIYQTSFKVESTQLLIAGPSTNWRLCLETGQTIRTDNDTEYYYPHNIYKTEFELNDKCWDDPVVWLAAHRCKTYPGEEGDPKYEDKQSAFQKQMLQEVQGLLAEVFLCNLYKWNLKEFWKLFCNSIGCGDGGWDVKVIPQKTGALITRDEYYIDVKSTKGAKTFPIGNKLPDGSLLAIVQVEWNFNQIRLTFCDLIDVESFRDWADVDGILERDSKKGHYFFSTCHLGFDYSPRYMPLLEAWPVIPWRCDPSLNHLHRHDVEFGG